MCISDWSSDLCSSVLTVPHFNGAGASQLVITDAPGRRDVVNFSFYAAQQLLQPGLFDYSVEVGAVRKDYGLSSFSYDDRPAASASLRYGLTDALTIETHGEASDGLALAGGGGAARLGRSGVLSAAGALSETRPCRGRQLRPDERRVGENGVRKVKF